MSARVDAALSEVRAELLSAMEKFPPLHSTHEGYAVIAEELDELWADVKANGTAAAIHEARQVAAMAVRFMIDCAPAYDGSVGSVHTDARDEQRGWYTEDACTCAATLRDGKPIEIDRSRCPIHADTGAA